MPASTVNDHSGLSWRPTGAGVAVMRGAPGIELTSEYELRSAGLALPAASRARTEKS
jgi:hypothetical protein